MNFARIHVSREWKIVWVLFCVSLGIKVYFLLQGMFNFSWDFARDLLWVRQLTEAHKPVLVGPWGSLDGTYFGPLYYYLLAVAMILFSGDPRGAVFMVSLFLTLLIPLGYYFGKKAIHTHAGMIFALVFFIQPIFYVYSLYSFSQQLIPLFYLVFLYTLWMYIKEKRIFWVLSACVVASLIFHLEPVDTPAAFLTLLGVFVWVNWKKKILHILGTGFLCIVAVLIPFVPNAVFDMRHGYGQTQAFIRFFSGDDQSLHGKLSLQERLVNRYDHIRFLFDDSTVYGKGKSFTALLLLLCIWALFERKKVWEFSTTPSAHRTFFVFLLWVLTATVLWFLAFSRLLKDYYLYMVPVLAVLCIGTLLAFFWKLGKVQQHIVVAILAIMVLLNGQTLIRGSFIRIHSQTYRVQKQIVDTIYSKANGQPFSAYTYTPLIYDYPFVYLFSWYGNRTYGYIPVEYAYLPSQPEYVLEKKRFDVGKYSKADQGTQRTYFILEHDEHAEYTKERWFGHFTGEKYYLQEFPGELQLYTLAQ